MASDVSATDSDSINTGTTNVVTNAPPGEDEQQKMLDFQSARVHLDRIIRDWDTEVEDTEIRRKTRKVEIDLEGLRQKGDMDEDETMVPQRLIDSNISREEPPYVNYIKNSRRIALFECLENPFQDSDLIEQEFTRVATYSGWEVPIVKARDGSASHGWDTIEVTYDPTKPGAFALEQIGHDKLLFPKSAIDIQQCPRIIRSYDVTIIQLQKWVKEYGFSGEMVQMMLKPRKETQKENETCRIYKLYFKIDGIVNVAWFCMTDGVTDWLKTPLPFDNGIDDPATGQPKPQTQYPFFVIKYRETEEAKIFDTKGRIFLDENKQEAQTALWSAFINGMNRASTVFASPDTDDGSGTSLKEIEDVLLRGGRILSKPMRFWHMDYPDPVVLRTLQYGEVSNDQETNQVNFAAMNREDSRKTAKEIGAAQQQQSLLNSVQLTLFSTFIREIYSYAWLITQSQALQNKFTFLRIQVPQMNPMTNQPMIGQDGQPVMQWVNNMQVIAMTYSIRAAGDVDVIQKQETEQKMQQDWPVVSNTPIANDFLINYLKIRYPDRGDAYAKTLGQVDQINQMKQLVGKLGTVLAGVLKDAPQAVNGLSMQEKQDLQQTMQEAAQISGMQPPK